MASPPDLIPCLATVLVNESEPQVITRSSSGIAHRKPIWNPMEIHGNQIFLMKFQRRYFVESQFAGNDLMDRLNIKHGSNRSIMFNPNAGETNGFTTIIK